ncbi:carboxymuconolactone decarboxylase family protein [Phenylobacterium sp.]|jgi:alkylhydroperoxidase family enzyme|uniref:carboxymuconolactone decarboxylase family protein n=1 Tax=Phenylobacterium sp. TaxID=1871053 RepID=UPI002E35FE9D|nr:carboxymuconolactone decarboxylase family protein [Phenylobacterium sp.]HEX2561812.1 carboxymuconolactone decarboxylase family protein [Phenylobacterium sp.]
MAPRIASAKAPYPAAVQTRLDRLMGGRPPLQLFQVLARDERLFTRFMDGGLLDPGHLTLRQRELAILRVCALCRSEYEWGAHVAIFAEQAGLSEAEVSATLRPSGEHPWPEPDRLVLALCEQLQDSCEVPEDSWSELRQSLGEMTLLELLLLIGKYRQVCILTNALRLDLEPQAARFPPHTRTPPCPGPLPQTPVR